MLMVLVATKKLHRNLILSFETIKYDLHPC